eukprot:EG_transcript_31945
MAVPADDATCPLRQRMRSYLNERMRLEVADGRTFIGTVICVDKLRNVILRDCTEYSRRPLQLQGGDKPWESTRYLGLALVPGQHITRFQVSVRPPAVTEESLAQLVDHVRLGD